MESEVLARFQALALSSKELGGLELQDGDISLGMEEAGRSLIGKAFGEKKANLVGVRSTMMKLWGSRGLCKVVSLDLNVFQFVFKAASDRDSILQGMPWFFDNQLLILHPWEAGLNWKDFSFSCSPFWVQVWHIPHQWISIETGKKIGGFLGTVKDVIIVDVGGQEQRHINVLVDIDVTKPLLRGTKLKHKQAECWVEFKYENLPLFCFYCGCIGHNEKGCGQRKLDVTQNKVLQDQFGYWLRAGFRRGAVLSGRRVSDRTEMENQQVKGVGTFVERSSDAKKDQGDQEVHKPSEKVAESSNLSWEGEGRIVVEEGREQVGLELRQQGELSKANEVLVLKNGDELQQFRQEGQHDSAEMQVETEAISLCIAGGQGHVTVEGSPIQEVEHYRVPLVDCTNRMEPMTDVGSREGNINLKGQWKRRARMQVAGNDEGLSNRSSMPDDEIRKRSRGNMAENFAETDSIPAGKKNKCVGQLEGDQNSEVVDTSRDWSQAYK